MKMESSNGIQGYINSTNQTNELTLFYTPSNKQFIDRKMVGATKSASLVKNTKISEKKWTETLSSNRHHDVQLTIDLAKYEIESKRAFILYECHKGKTERRRTDKQKRWNQIDASFRNHLNEQLKPTPLYSRSPSPTSLVPLKRSFTSTIQPKPVLSKQISPKVVLEHEPKLHSARHASFLDTAQRFIERTPEFVENDTDFHKKQKQRNHYLRMLLDNERERTRSAASKFSRRIYKETNPENTDNDDDDSLH